MASARGKLRKQQQLTAHAHRMRVAPSEPERVLWQALRCCQLGVQFRQQVVLHGFIVDFFAPGARVVVEVDGAHHARRRGADKRRDRVLQAAGLTAAAAGAGRAHWAAARATAYRAGARALTRVTRSPSRRPGVEFGTEPTFRPRCRE